MLITGYYPCKAHLVGRGYSGGPEVEVSARYHWHRYGAVHSD